MRKRRYYGTIRHFQFTDNEDQSRIVESADPEAFKVEADAAFQPFEKYSLTTVDILIIDVEGAELNVLRSIHWKECRFGRIFCELHP